MVSQTEKKLQWTICQAEVVRMISKGEDWSSAYHSQNFETGHFLNHVVNFNRNLPRRDDFFQQELRWGCESRMWSWIRILWSHVITRINLEKFCHDFIEKLITTTNVLDDCTTNTLDDFCVGDWLRYKAGSTLSGFKIIPAETVNTVIQVQYHIICLVPFWASNIIVMLFLSYLLKLLVFFTFSDF